MNLARTDRNGGSGVLHDEVRGERGGRERFRRGAEGVGADFSRLGDGARPGQVADAVGIEPPSLVRIIEQLVNAGLVLRQEDPTDRRAKTLSLTANGKRMAERLEKALVPFRRELFKDVPQADVEATVRVLMKLDQVLAERNAS